MRPNKGKRDTRNHIFKPLACTIQENNSTTENKKYIITSIGPMKEKMLKQIIYVKKGNDGYK